MKTLTISATLLLLAGLAHTAPNPAPAQVKARQGPNEVTAVFFGAGPNPPSYTEDIPTDGSVVSICTSDFYLGH